jgi:hypothetical protein
MSIIILDGEQYKVCTKCKQSKILSEFGKRKRSKDGYGYWCRTCQSGYIKNRSRSSKPNPKKELDYFTKLGVTSFIEGFSKVYEKAKEGYLCEIKSPYREQLEKLLGEVFKESIIPIIQKKIPQQYIQIQEEVKKLQSLLLEKDAIIRRKDAVLESDKEQINDFYLKLGELPKRKEL